MGLREKFAALRDILASIENETTSFEWQYHPKRYADQMVSGVTWYSRNVPTPDGKAIWASDGKQVWTIRGNGEPIDRCATAVLYWSEMLIPEPPKPEEVLWEKENEDESQGQICGT